MIVICTHNVIGGSSSSCGRIPGWDPEIFLGVCSEYEKPFLSHQRTPKLASVSLLVWVGLAIAQSKTPGHSPMHQLLLRLLLKPIYDMKSFAHPTELQVFLPAKDKEEKTIFCCQ